MPRRSVVTEQHDTRTDVRWPHARRCVPVGGSNRRHQPSALDALVQPEARLIPGVVEPERHARERHHLAATSRHARRHGACGDEAIARPMTARRCSSSAHRHACCPRAAAPAPAPVHQRVQRRPIRMARGGVRSGVVERLAAPLAQVNHQTCLRPRLGSWPRRWPFGAACARPPSPGLRRQHRSPAFLRRNADRCRRCVGVEEGRRRFHGCVRGNRAGTTFDGGLPAIVAWRPGVRAQPWLASTRQPAAPLRRRPAAGPARHLVRRLSAVRFRAGDQTALRARRRAASTQWTCAVKAQALAFDPAVGLRRLRARNGTACAWICIELSRRKVGAGVGGASARAAVGLGVELLYRDRVRGPSA